MARHESISQLSYNLLAICTQCLKKHNEKMTGASKWVKFGRCPEAQADKADQDLEDEKKSQEDR
jgi:hypothetical protein